MFKQCEWTGLCFLSFLTVLYSASDSCTRKNSERDFSSLFVLDHGLVIPQLLNFSSRDHCKLTEKILKPDGGKEDAFEGGVKIARNYLTALGACNLSGSKPDSDSKGETTDQS